MDKVRLVRNYNGSGRKVLVCREPGRGGIRLMAYAFVHKHIVVWTGYATHKAPESTDISKINTLLGTDASGIVRYSPYPETSGGMGHPIVDSYLDHLRSGHIGPWQ